ncbi:hypothetical protein KBC80_02445 [Candidatus Woesebacteria bacterium]|nr:hypothetical protein [Candidatus Woesebacteria bacterium]
MDKFFSVFGKFVLIALILGGVAYGAYRLGTNTASNTPYGAVSVTSAPSPTIDPGLTPDNLPVATKTPSVISAGLGAESGLSFTKYKLTVLDNWTPNHTTTNEGTWMDTLTLTRGTAQIKIFQGATGGAMCFYPGDTVAEGPSSSFDEFTEITTTEGVKFRRGNTKGVASFTICAKGSDTYGQPTNFGHISYKTANPPDLVTLTEMDAMIASIKKQ